jgi:iron(III) transport system permease protein
VEGKLNSEKLSLGIAVFFLAFLGLIPVLSVVANSFVADGNFSLDNYGGLLQSSREWRLLANSLLFALATTASTCLLGVPLGILLARTDLPLRRAFTTLFMVPLIIPPYILAIAWFYFLGGTGVLARLLGEDSGRLGSRLLFGFPGAVFVMTSAYLPIVIILTMTFLRTINPKLEESARLYAGWRMVLRKISLPMVAPGILLASVLVFVLTLGEFGVPMTLRFDVFSVESFIHISAFHDFNTGAAAAIPLVLIVLVMICLERKWMRGKMHSFELTQGQMLVVHLKKTKPFIMVGTFVLAFLLVLIPLAVLVSKSSALETCRVAFLRSSGSVARSLLYAFAGASCLTMLGFFLGYLFQRKTSRFSMAVDSLALFLFALPGAVIGLGLMRFWNTRATGFVYGSAVIIIIGFIAKFSAVGSRVVIIAFSQVPDSMEEAARVAGGGWLRRIMKIWIPLMRKGLLGAWLVGFLFCLRDLDVTMMIYPPGGDTLPVHIFTIMANSPEEVIAAMCLIMVATALLPLGILGRVFRRMR